VDLNPSVKRVGAGVSQPEAWICNPYECCGER